MKITENQLRNIIKQTIKESLHEGEYDGWQEVWGLVEELESVMSMQDILSSLIGHIGTYPAIKYLKDIKRVAGLNVEDDDEENI